MFLSYLILIAIIFFIIRRYQIPPNKMIEIKCRHSTGLSFRRAGFDPLHFSENTDKWADTELLH